MLNPTAAVQRLKQYHPPLGGREGLRLDFNENTTGCSPRVLSRLRQLSAEDLTRYPEREPVEAAIAQWLGIESSQVVLTNGVDEGIPPLPGRDRQCLRSGVCHGPGAGAPGRAAPCRAVGAAFRRRRG